MLYNQVAEKVLLERPSSSCISSPSQIRTSSRKCLLKSIFPPLAPGFSNRCFLKLCLQQQGSRTLGVSRVLCAVLSENLPQLPDLPYSPTISVSSPLMEQFSPNANLEQLFRVFPHTHSSSSALRPRFLSPTPLLLYFLLEPPFYITVLTDLHDRTVSACPSSPLCPDIPYGDALLTCLMGWKAREEKINGITHWICFILFSIFTQRPWTSVTHLTMHCAFP